MREKGVHEKYVMIVQDMDEEAITRMGVIVKDTYRRYASRLGSQSEKG